jgi:hypothetical protein
MAATVPVTRQYAELLDLEKFHQTGSFLSPTPLQTPVKNVFLMFKILQIIRKGVCK